MYEFIRGRLIAMEASKAIIETHGIGFSLEIPINTPFMEIGSEVLFYTAFIVREDSQRLFGFKTKGERELFFALSDISGIGPKTALSIVGHMDIDTLKEAVSAANPVFLCKIPGIGKKTAERLILELKDRLPKSTGPSDLFIDATSALTNLGYSLPVAQKAVKAALPAASLSELITKALQSV